jgi:3-oxoacyl-[acyl-carrier protein] reductase
MAENTRRIAVITGASRGIGAATGQHLAKLGWHVALLARSKEAVETLADQIIQDGGSARAIAVDVADFSAMEHAFAQIGHVDLLVNNAGLIDPIARLEDSDPAAWSHVVDVNLKGVYYGIRLALPLMRAQGGGTIVNISSGAASGALEGWSHYCATKAAVLSLTKCVHKEHGGQGIRCIGLSPGTVATQMQVQIKASGVNPVSQLDPSVHVSPQWVGRAISWLTTPEADSYCGTDFSLKTDGGRAAIGLPDIGA